MVARRSLPPTDGPREPAFSCYGRQLSQGFSRLRFFAPLEEEFRRHYLAQNVHRGRLSALVALMLMTAIVGIDFSTGLQGGVDLRGALRTGGMVGLILVMLLLSVRASLRRHYDITAACCAASFGVVVAFISVTASVDGISYLFSGVLLLTVFVYLFLGVLFYTALLVNAAVVTAFFGWGAVLGLPGVEMAHQTAMLIAASVLGAMGAYSLEYAVRSSYLESALLREQAHRDGLTGLHNRRIFDSHLERMWKQAGRDKVAFGILFIDIDYFKVYNDLYGHQAGDECLQRVARILERAARRPFDMCSRYGGEEFMLLLYDPEPDFAEHLPEAIRQQVAALRIEHAGSAVADWVTVSIGAARVRPGEGRSLAGAIQMADEALYQAKDEGRDRVVVRDSAYSPMITGIFQVQRVNRVA